jgi:cold shock CspA family protein
VFVHISAVERAGLGGGLHEGLKVSYEVVNDPKRRKSFGGEN